jgi:hypothetical protein
MASGFRSNRSKKSNNSEYTLFDVVYEDGSRSSNRKVPTADLSGPERDGPAKDIIEAQDRKIAEASGKSRGSIKSVNRVGR